MIPNYTPPPPQPAPAQVQTISAAHAQRLSSPGQSVINNINSGQYGKGMTARMPNQQQQAKDLNKSVEGIAKGVGKLGTARSASETIKAQSKAAQGPGFTDRPTTNKGIANMKAKTKNGQPSASKNVSQAGSNKGIEAARQKSSSNQTGTGTSKANNSSNKGIANFQNKSSGQNSSAAKSSSNAATSAAKSSSPAVGKSSSGSGAGKSGGGQSR